MINVPITDYPSGMFTSRSWRPGLYMSGRLTFNPQEVPVYVVEIREDTGVVRRRYFVKDSEGEKQRYFEIADARVDLVTEPVRKKVGVRVLAELHSDRRNAPDSALWSVYLIDNPGVFVGYRYGAQKEVWRLENINQLPINKQNFASRSTDEKSNYALLMRTSVNTVNHGKTSMTVRVPFCQNCANQMDSIRALADALKSNYNSDLALVSALFFEQIGFQLQLKFHDN